MWNDNDWLVENENEIDNIRNLNVNEDNKKFELEYKNHFIELRKHNNLKSQFFLNGIKNGYELGKIIGNLEGEIE